MGWRSSGNGKRAGWGVYVDTRTEYWSRNSQLAQAASWGMGSGWAGRETRGQAAALGKQPQHNTCPGALAPAWGARARGALKKSADKERAAQAAVPHPPTHTQSCAGAGGKPGPGFLVSCGWDHLSGNNGDPRCVLGQQPVKGEMAKTGPLAQPGGDSSNWLT